MNCPKVLPDRAVDTSSIESIVDCVLKPGMTKQDQFLALYEFFRRMIFHHRYMGGDRRDPMRVINSYGYQLCGSQAATFTVLLRKAGFTTRVAHVDAKGYGMHTVTEVNYDGAWHLCDTMTSFYVLNRKGQVASLAELKADPTLVRDAVKEERVPVDYCLCSREIAEEQTGIEKHVKKDRPWTLLRWGKDTTVAKFWDQAILTYRTQGGAYGGRTEPGLLDIKLKPNEEYVRLWDNVGLWLKDPSASDLSPFHTCGHIDEQDKNFKYFEPYRKTGIKFTRCCYRYYGNGWLEWKPDPARGELEAYAGKITNLKRDSGSGPLRIVTAGKRGTIVIPVKSPYAVVKVEVDLNLYQSDDARTRISIRNNETRRARFKKIWEKNGKSGGLQKIEYLNESVPMCRYDIKIDIQGDDVRVDVIRVKTIFQLNWSALPSLYPGKNTVNISAKEETELKDNNLVVIYEWQEGKGWTKNRRDMQKIRKFPSNYKVNVDVPSDKMPRMKKLVLRLDAK
ncbi:MAG: hypothetical protein KAH23_05265 [Kiritimatiellae bacterium]|nr:hypothetical protein [Kiritimatiellia bacterium]